MATTHDPNRPLPEGPEARAFGLGAAQLISARPAAAPGAPFPSETSEEYEARMAREARIRRAEAEHNDPFPADYDARGDRFEGDA